MIPSPSSPYLQCRRDFINPLDKKLQFSMRYEDCVRHDGLFKTRCRWWSAFAYFSFAHLSVLIFAVSLMVGLGAEADVRYSLEASAAFYYYLRNPLTAAWVVWILVALVIGVWGAASAISLRWLALPDSAKTNIS